MVKFIVIESEMVELCKWEDKIVFENDDWDVCYDWILENDTSDWDDPTHTMFVVIPESWQQWLESEKA